MVLLGADKGSSELLNTKAGLPSSKVIYPDTSRMIIYDPRQTNGMQAGIVSFIAFKPSKKTVVAYFSSLLNR